MRITVVGIGYVGLATAALWAAAHDVTVLDVVPDKVDAVNQGRCPFADGLLQQRLAELRAQGRPLKAALNRPGALAASDAVFVAAPTNYDEETRSFDTRIVEGVLQAAADECPDAAVVLRSTVQPGLSDALAARMGIRRMLFCPEFLREGSSLHDCLRPDRVVVGAAEPSLAREYRGWLEEVYAAQGLPVPPIVECTLAEAEAAKLFANAYLATRVAFFNELDSFALARGLDSGKIIQAMSLDARIGDYYNNPSFGYGGYCLPKDSKALLCSFGDDVPHDVIGGVVTANAARQRFLANQVLARSPRCVGVHRLVAKHGSDNLRSSAMAGVVEALVEGGADVLVYEPMLHSRIYHGARVTDDLGKLLESCDVILANRASGELAGFQGQVITRDLFTRD